MPINLELDGIKGDALLKDFKAWITLVGFEFKGDHSNPTPHSGRGSLPGGVATIFPLEFSKLVDKASAKLWESLTKGLVVKSGKLLVTGNNQGAAMTLATYTFEDIRVVSMTNEAAERDGVSTFEERGAFSFRKATLTVPGLNNEPQTVWEYDQIRT